MNIFHQLRTGGDPDLVDIYREVPWAEFMEKPGQTEDELLARWKVIGAIFLRARTLTYFWKYLSQRSELLAHLVHASPVSIPC